ncbi:MAG: hypothetical protein KBF89_03320 [Acidimicrobiia bacterium]|nr:hypothetical protein [Acidimicrobiia bacterium]
MNKNRKLTIILMACVLLLVGLGVFKLLIPKYNEISKRADENSETAKVANDKLELAKSLNPKSIEKRLKKLQARVPNSLELPNVILKINERADLFRLQWLEGTPEDVIALDSIPSAPSAKPVPANPNSTVTPSAPQLDNHEVSIKVRGNMNDVIGFLESITNKSVGRIVVITSTNITTIGDVEGGQSADPNLVEVEIKMNLIGWAAGGNIDSAGCIEDPTTPAPECVLTPEGN